MKYTKPTVSVASNGDTTPTPRGGCTIYSCTGKHSCSGSTFSCSLLYF